MRAVLGTGSGRSQVQLLAVRLKPVQFGGHFAQGGGLLEERLRPPPGYKDTTVPGIFSRDTPFSHGNHEPGWVVAPGMQGMQVQPFTANMLTPESLAELLGGPDIAPAAGNQLARTAECV